MSLNRVLDLVLSFPKALQLLTACLVSSVSLQAQEPPLLPQERTIPGRDMVNQKGRLLPPHERLRMQEQGVNWGQEKPEIGKLEVEKLRAPEWVKGDDRTDVSHGSFLTPRADATSFWVARYSGGVNSNDYAYDIASDSRGNVYVTGFINFLSGADYATIKYSSEGTEQWVARYSGAGNYDDYAFALAVDAGGNVYVTGTASGNYATIKYNSAGEVHWVALSGPSSYASALDIDSSGNVYVTGHEIGSDFNIDYKTIKYDASGSEQWVARYDGPGNHEDWATDIAVDGSGNVYVTGYSGINPSEDLATLKYNALGEQQWVARYDGAGNSQELGGSLAIDTSGNVYVTGSSWGSVTNQDYVTLKYNSVGVQQWVARYEESNSDFATAITVDASGNVYVTGFIGENSGDYATIKYDSGGAQNWVARYDGLGGISEDHAFDLDIDGSGNVYVVGHSGTYPNFDYATIKYDAFGSEQWVARYNGPGNNYDVANAVFVDNNGNVCVTGRSVDSRGYFDYTTIRYTFIVSVSVSLSPQSGDGTFEYDVEARNNTDTSQTVDIWTELVDPHDARKEGKVMTGKALRSRRMYTESGTSTLKENSPLGEYEFVVNVGTYPDSIIASASAIYILTSLGKGSSLAREALVPTETALLGNYPNPFNPSTTLRYKLAEPGQVSLKVYNMLGQLVRTVVDEHQVEGYYEAVWDGRNETGAAGSSGIYVYRMTAGNLTVTKRMVLMK